MSLNGSINYSLQNIENTNLNEDIYNSLDYRIAQNENDIIALESKDIEHDGQISTINSSLNSYNSRITQNENNISTLQTTTQNHEVRLTDISYSDDGLSGLTTIANKLLVQARHDWGIYDDCHLELKNTSVDGVQQFKTQLFTGIEHQLHQDAIIATTGDTCIVNTSTSNNGVSKGITLCGRYGTHATTPQGLRIGLDGGQSRYYGGQFVFDCPGSSVVFMQEFFIYTAGGIGKTLNTYLTDSVVGVRTTGFTYDTGTDTTTIDNNLTITKELIVNGLNIKNQLDTNTNNISTNTTNIATNTTNIATNTTNITTNTNNISSLQSTLSGITYTSSGDTTTINNNLVVGSGKSLTVSGLDVKSNIDTINTKITGFSYTSGTDTTTISNNIDAVKTLTCENLICSGDITIDGNIIINAQTSLPVLQTLFDDFNSTPISIGGNQGVQTGTAKWINVGSSGSASNVQTTDYSTVSANHNRSGVILLQADTGSGSQFKLEQHYTQWNAIREIGLYVMTLTTYIFKTRVRYGIADDKNWNSSSNSFCLRNIDGEDKYYAEYNGSPLTTLAYKSDPVVPVSRWTNISGFTEEYNATLDTYVLTNVGNQWLKVIFTRQSNNDIKMIIKSDSGYNAETKIFTGDIPLTAKPSPFVSQWHLSSGYLGNPYTYCDWIYMTFETTGISL